jgi:hypothetical protein
MHAGRFSSKPGTPLGQEETMKHTMNVQPISYVSWILGQTSALLGVILCLLWGFDLVILQSQRLVDQANGVSSGMEAWSPIFGPTLIGLGIAGLGWLFSHFQHLKAPAPVLVGAGLNLLALVLAILALTF